MSVDVAAIRQAIAKGLVAFYQKCESLLYRNTALGTQVQPLCACVLVSVAFQSGKGWLLLMHISVEAQIIVQHPSHWNLHIHSIMLPTCSFSYSKCVFFRIRYIHSMCTHVCNSSMAAAVIVTSLASIRSLACTLFLSCGLQLQPACHS